MSPARAQVHSLAAQQHPAALSPCLRVALTTLLLLMVPLSVRMCQQSKQQRMTGKKMTLWRVECCQSMTRLQQSCCLAPARLARLPLQLAALLRALVRLLSLRLSQQKQRSRRTGVTMMTLATSTMLPMPQLWNRKQVTRTQGLCCSALWYHAHTTWWQRACHA